MFSITLRKGVFRISEIAEKVAVRKMFSVILVLCLVYFFERVRERFMGDFYLWILT